MDRFPRTKKGILIVLGLAILGILIYASTNKTLEYFGTIGSGNVKISNWLQALANDSCKTYLPMCLGVTWAMRKYFVSFLIVITILCTITVSYFASQGLDLNIANKDQKTAMTSDSKFTINTTTFEDSMTYLQSLRTKRDEAENFDVSTTFDSDSTIISLQKEYEYAKKMNYRTTTATSGRRGMDVISKDIRTRQQQIREEHQTKIDDIKADIKHQEGLKETSSGAINNMKLSDVKTTVGHTSLANFLGVEVGYITRFINMLTEFMSLVISLTIGALLGGQSEGIMNRMRQGRSKMVAGFKNMKNGNKETVTASGNVNSSTTSELGKVDFFKDNKLGDLVNKFIPKKKYKTKRIGFQGSTLDKATKEYMRFILTNVKPDGTLLGITNLEKVCKKQGLTNTRGTWDTMKKLNIIEKVNGSMVINQDMVNKWL